MAAQAVDLELVYSQEQQAFKTTLWQKVQASSATGNAAAQYFRGRIHFDCWTANQRTEVGIQHREQAIKWFQKAADQNVVEAQFYFGLTLLSSYNFENIELGLQALRKAQQRGHIPSRILLARHAPDLKEKQEMTQLIFKDSLEKIEAIKKIEACVSLADQFKAYSISHVVWDVGFNKEQAKKLALEWYEKAAQLGCLESSRRVAVMLTETKETVDQGIQRLITLIKGKNGDEIDAGAIVELFKIHQHTPLPEETITQLFTDLKSRAAERPQQAVYQFQVGYMLAHGFGIKGNDSEALKYLWESKKNQKKSGSLRSFNEACLCESAIHFVHDRARKLVSMRDEAMRRIDVLLDYERRCSEKPTLLQDKSLGTNMAVLHWDLEQLHKSFHSLKKA